MIDVSEKWSAKGNMGVKGLWTNHAQVDVSKKEGKKEERKKEKKRRMYNALSFPQLIPSLHRKKIWRDNYTM